jgi:hypothetical protein
MVHINGNGRSTNGRFTKGWTGGGGGRPKGYAAFKERAEAFMDAEGLTKLLDMARNNNEFALKLLCEYAFGKPQAHVDVTSDGQALIKAYLGVDLEKV